MNETTSKGTVIPKIATGNEIVVQTKNDAIAPVQTTRALGPEEWDRLNGLRKRIETEPYHTMLGIPSGSSPSEVQHRVAVLNDWLESIEKRPGLNGEERAALASCKAHIPSAEWVLTDPELGPSYMSRVSERQENEGT
jgi:hypothetical protein